MGTDTRKSQPRQALVSRNPDVVAGRILDAAQAEFMQVGYERANTNRVVQRFGGSKATLFRHFPTKKALLVAVIRRIASRWSDEVKWTEIDQMRPHEWLNAFGYMALKWILREENIFVGRTAISEGDLLPEVSVIFRTQASEPIQKILSHKLQEWIAEKSLPPSNPDRAASSFLDLVLSGEVNRALYKVDRSQTPSRMKNHVKHAVDLFLYGVATPQPRHS